MKHWCPRCGLEASRRRWWDEHPFLATVFALLAGYTLIGVMLVFPWFTIPVTMIVCAGLLERSRRRRAAIVARAEWAYREEMVTAMNHGGPPPGGFYARQARAEAAPTLARPRQPAPWHLVTQLPTERFRRVAR